MYKDIDLTSAKKVLGKQFFNFDFTDFGFYKGITSESNISDFLLFEPENEIRGSKTVHEHGNLYNLLLNELDCWSTIPLRKNSIIFSNNYKTAESFSNQNGKNGKLFKVFFKTESPLVISPKSDIWYSFQKGLSILGLRGKNSNLTFFNTVFKEIFESCNIENYDTDFDYFVSNLKKISTEKIIPAKNLDFEATIVYKWVLSQNKSVLDSLEEVFNPYTNKFQIVGYNQSLNFNKNCNNEIWSDSKALLVAVDKLPELIE